MKTNKWRGYTITGDVSELEKCALILEHLGIVEDKDYSDRSLLREPDCVPVLSIYRRDYCFHYNLTINMIKIEIKSNKFLKEYRYYDSPLWKVMNGGDN